MTEESRRSFLIDSGVDEFPQSREPDLRAAMAVLAKAGVPLLAHAELDSSGPGPTSADPRSYKGYLDSRPQRWEVDAVRLLIQLIREEMHKLNPSLTRRVTN